MKSSIYKLDSIPDLTLSKYSSLSENGVEGVLLRHEAFLRQWQRICIIENISIHYIATYLPYNTIGQRLNIYFEIVSDNSEAINKCNKLLFSSPISDYFRFVECSEDEKNRLHNLTFKYRACLMKKERVFESIVYKDSKTNQPIRFFTVPSWELNKKARLYDMFRLMQALNETVVYKVDLFGIDAYDTLFNVFKEPINKLREIRDKRSDKISLTSGKSHSLLDKQRDVAAEETLKQYEEFLDDVGTSPYFKANISVYMDNKDSAKILLDSACSEALDEGDSFISVKEETSFNVFPSSPTHEIWKKDISNTFSFWPTLFSINDTKPFFCFPVLYDGEYLEIGKETDAIIENDAQSHNDKIIKYNQNISIGHDMCNREILFPCKNLNKHIFIAGTPGSGKTNTMLLLCYNLWMKNKIPFLVLEPAKKEYRTLALTDIDNLIVFSPSANSKFPLALNPFEFVKGLSLSEHIQNLMQVFQGAFPLDPPLPSILDRAIESSYKNLGWNPDDINDGTRNYPRMSQVYQQLSDELKATDYSGEVMGNMKAAMEMRIGSLLKRDLGNVFDVATSSLLPEEWIEKPIIIELESLGEGPSNFLTLMLCTLIREILKVNPNSNNLMETRHVMFIEEAHNLIGPTTYNKDNSNPDPKISATAYIVKMLAEVRALRESIIIADQLPTAMAPEVIKNTGTKIAHRITSLDDRNLVGQTISATPLQIEQMATFIKGKTLMSYEGLMKPFTVQITLLPAKDLEPPSNDELFNKIYNFSDFKKCRNRYYYSYIKKTFEKLIAIQLRCKNYIQYMNMLNVKLNHPDKNNQTLVKNFENLKDRIANDLREQNIIISQLKKVLNLNTIKSNLGFTSMKEIINQIQMQNELEILLSQIDNCIYLLKNI